MSGAWPQDLPRSLDYPDVGVGALLAGAARAYGERTALLDGETALSFAGLHDRALRLAQGLRERGLRPGETVGLLLPNSLGFAVGYYGALLAGAVVSPLNPAQPAGVLREQLDEAAVVAVLTQPDSLPVLRRAAAPGVRLTVLTTAAAEAEVRAGAGAGAEPGVVPLDELLRADPAPAASRHGSDLAHLSFTGGTTGRSKAVRVLHRNALANALQAACWRCAVLPELDEAGGLRLAPLGTEPGRYDIPVGRGVVVAVAPLFHAMGLTSMNVSVVQGTTMVLCGRFEPGRYLDLVERHRANAVVGSPPMFRALLADAASAGRDLSFVRVVSSGAAPIDRVTLDRLRGLFPDALVAEGYGLSEATMALTLGPVRPTTPQPPFGSVGLPVFDTEVQIRALDEPGRALPPGEIGEVWARGPQVADGYQGDSELSSGQFTEGWLRTGDLGRLDDDGYLFLEGRIKDMLIYKGYNVYPQQLEELLCGHPDVAQASVVGIPVEGVGEIPVAYVVPRPSRPVTEDQLTAYVAERVVPYARLRGLRLVDALPVSAAGKVLKNRLREEWV